MPVPADGESFSFPYAKPYDIQLQLMGHAYGAMSNSQVTVLESPTGTGKSLSIISSTLTWLRHARAQAREDLIASVTAKVADGQDDEPEWVLDAEVKRQLALLEREEKDLEERLNQIRTKERDARDRGPRKRIKLAHAAAEPRSSEDEFAPDQYDSDEDANKVAEDGPDNLTPAVREALRKLSGGTHKHATKEEDEPDVQKIFYASRTHSQLSQFVSEVRKTPFAGSSSIDVGRLPSSNSSNQPPPGSMHPVRVIPLGSRQNLCINDDVRSKGGGSNDALGDMCLELQKGGPDKRCPFLPPRDEPSKMNAFRDRALASVHDIEDIEELGRKMHTCPYYGSRRALRSAELVTLPYNMLIQKNAREALGISLRNHVVVIDEAHNLIQTLLDLNTVVITSTILHSLRGALLIYLTKFKNRFKGSNAMYLKQLIAVLRALAEFADAWAKSVGAGQTKKEAMMSVNEVVGSLKGAMDQVNLLKLDQYLTNSRIARKIGGYLDSLEEEKTAKGRQALRSNATRNLHRLQSFLVSLTNAQRDGRILLSAEPIATPTILGQPGPTKIEVTLKYMLLAPSDSFKDVVEEARSVILAGGTMSPMSDFREQLFPYLPAERFSTFSCGHIVAPDRIRSVAVGKGPSGLSLNFTFENRKNEKLIDELGQAILNICSIVPKGVVVFVPSKDFLAQIQSRWSTSGLLNRLARKKKPFWEPKERAEVEPALRDYAAANAATDSGGGILFAVVDAKLSEGINFADDMARAVVIVGIPYPSRHSTEIQERMKYLNSFPRHSSLSVGKDAGQVLYQNMAFRGVNQSIGRAIRHQFDWAGIILLDERYQQPKNQALLPAWLGSDVQSPTTFGGVMKELSSFYLRLAKERSAT